VADQHRVLSSETSAAPGEWRTLPFQREPLDAIGLGSPFEPRPMLIVLRTLSIAKAFSKGRLRRYRILGCRSGF